MTDDMADSDWVVASSHVGTKVDDVKSGDPEFHHVKNLDVASIVRLSIPRRQTSKRRRQPLKFHSVAKIRIIQMLKN